MKNWCSNFDYESELSRDFLMDLKDLKILTEKDMIEDHKK